MKDAGKAVKGRRTKVKEGNDEGRVVTERSKVRERKEEGRKDGESKDSNVKIKKDGGRRLKRRNGGEREKGKRESEGRKRRKMGMDKR